jgi:16S rRNA (adenine1518-N6/adenine1519-N6)-dimethyltransferase
MENVETIKEIARKIGIKPKEGLGQNFLVDKKILDSIICSADVTNNDNILEIGPGFGVLSKELARRAKKVLLVETDRTLFAYLKKEFSQKENFEIINEDILKIPNKKIKEKLGGDYKIVSNIPYSITGKIIRKFVSDSDSKPFDAFFLVQKEVAERICAKPGKMSLLALSVQIFGNPEIIFNVSKNSFWPEPKVESSFLRISKISKEPKIFVLDIKKFWQTAKIGFSSPRKQLHNNLVAGFKKSIKEVEEALNLSGIKKTARAQELSLEQWQELCKFL